MFKNSCPGSTEIRSPSPENITCHKCGKSVEIWTDETEAKCKHCGEINTRDRGPSCIDWCAYAKECVGEEKYKRLKTSK
jgi:hypothetical protein